MDFTGQARVHAALGDETRLRLVEALWLNDRTPRDLGNLVDIDSNLLAHHLDVLEEAGMVRRSVSAGDRRRRYVRAQLDVLDGVMSPPAISAYSVLFVCTHNSARSLFAERLLSQAGVDAQSAGTNPSDWPHPKAVAASAEVGVDLTGRRPRPYVEVAGRPDLVVSVCDRARESIPPFTGPCLHWSVPDPVDTGRIDSFREAFGQISERVARLIEMLERGDTI